MDVDDARFGRHASLRAVTIPVIFMLFSIVIGLDALQMPFGSFSDPGAGFFPLLLSFSLLTCAIVLLGMQWRGKSMVPTPEPVSRDVLWLIGALFAAAWLFERAGFLITMTLFLGVVLKKLAGRSWATTVVLALAGSIASFILFDRLLHITLPSGLLPF